MTIIPGTNHIDKDEPCWGLYEINLKTPDQHDRHRYQVIWVIRNDKPAEFRIDLGNVDKFKNADQFIIPGGIQDNGKLYIEETVGRLQDMANKMRKRPLFDKMDLALSGIARKKNEKLIFS